MQFSIFNNTKRVTPKIRFEKIKDRILGKRYELSLVFCGDKLSRRLNRTYRNKDYPTNILSFPISKTKGEVFINLSRTKGLSRVKSRGFSPAHLFIHGLLHLKGMRHGDRMEKTEIKFLKEFNVQ